MVLVRIEDQAAAETVAPSDRSGVCPLAAGDAARPVERLAMTEWDYTCVHCGMVSHNPMDALERYCAACHQWADDHASSLSYHWILDENHRPVRAPLSVWGPWFEHLENRQVAETFTQTTRISTVFLGLNHQWDERPAATFRDHGV